MFDADGDLLEYIKGFVHDKNGRCLKSEIIQSIVYNWVGFGVDITTPSINGKPGGPASHGGTWCPYVFAQRIGDNSLISKMMSKLQNKLEEFEKSNIYEGTGLSIETSKLTGRMIYKYVEVIGLIDLIDLIN